MSRLSGFAGSKWINRSSSTSVSVCPIFREVVHIQTFSRQAVTPSGGASQVRGRGVKLEEKGNVSKKILHKRGVNRNLCSE